jgi:hypothetical protein
MNMIFWSTVVEIVTNVWQQVVIVYWIAIHMYFISLDQYDDIYTKKIKYSLESVNA